MVLLTEDLKTEHDDDHEARSSFKIEFGAQNLNRFHVFGFRKYI